MKGFTEIVVLEDDTWARIAVRYSIDISDKECPLHVGDVLFVPEVVEG